MSDISSFLRRQESRSLFPRKRESIFFWIPVVTGKYWIPAYAGMTVDEPDVRPHSDRILDNWYRGSMTLPPIPLPSRVLDPSSHTLVMGVVNTTPDSFSDGGKHLDPEVAIRAGLEMLEVGADIIDVGGESTRPGSSSIDAEEEIARTRPVIIGILQGRPDAVVSIDTRRRPVAETAIKAGAQIINDVTGFRDDPSMIDLARESGVAVVVMHMLGSPKTMQIDIRYESFPHDIHKFLSGADSYSGRGWNRTRENYHRSRDRVRQNLRSESDLAQSSGYIQRPWEACLNRTCQKSVSWKDPRSTNRR